MEHIHCPNCLSPKVKKNGHTHHGKQKRNKKGTNIWFTGRRDVVVRW